MNTPIYLDKAHEHWLSIAPSSAGEGLMVTYHHPDDPEGEVIEDDISEDEATEVVREYKANVFCEAVEAFASAFGAVDDFWMPELGDQPSYPFGESFEELRERVGAWLLDVLHAHRRR